MIKIVNFSSKWLVTAASLLTLYSTAEALPPSMTNQGFYMGAGVIGARTQCELQPPEGGGFNLRLESRLSC